MVEPTIDISGLKNNRRQLRIEINAEVSRKNRSEGQICFHELSKYRVHRRLEATNDLLYKYQ